MVQIGSKEYVKLLDEAHNLVLDESYPGEPKFDRNVSAVVVADIIEMAIYDTLHKNSIIPENNPELRRRLVNTLDARIRRKKQKGLVDAKNHKFNSLIRALPPEPLYRLDPKE